MTCDLKEVESVNVVFAWQLLAGCMRRYYVGFDLRPEQIEANTKQRETMMGPSAQLPLWYRGDSAQLLQLCQSNQCMDSDEKVMGPAAYQGKADAVLLRRYVTSHT